MATRDLWALVLAGGDGTRLTALTRAVSGAPIPKQYCRLLGDRSLLEATLARVAPAIPPARTLVIVNRDHLALAAEQLAGIPPENVIVQPGNRDTGPGLALSLVHLVRRAPQARVAIFPSDHWIGDGRAFLRHVARAATMVERERRTVLLGIVPDRADTGYGYIEPGVPLPGTRGFEVAAFHEKPDPAAAARLVARGALWNSFVMVARADRLLADVRAVRPSDVGILAALAARPAALAEVYPSLPAWNFSRDFLARVTDHLTVLRADGVAWNDWGTPQAIAHTVAGFARTPPWWSRVAALAAAVPAAAAL